MQRNLDLVRSILLATAEAQGSVDANALTDSRFGFTDVAYHIEMMRDAGLIEGLVVKTSPNQYLRARVDSVTWEGHDYLASIRNDSVWSRVKQSIVKVAGSATFALIKRMGEQELEKLLLGN
ncbi:MAG: DUF2513 domain-containing protein [Atopobiaceae bacterium]|nr:DUF2513 domain-containing protein [Atopobiaceae bacterium]